MRSVGTIRHETRKAKGRERAYWIITCEPHVAIRIKRVFARIEKGKSGELLLIDIPETARELRWFLDRYPMEVAEPLHLESQAEKHRDIEATVELVLAGSLPSPIDLAVPLRSYQQQAVALALASGSLLLADDVGLGKTAQGIGMLADPRARPGLVVTLTHLPRQWAAEFATFAPDLEVYIAKTANPQDELKRHFRKVSLFKPDVYILSYSKLAGWSDHLAPVIRGMVLDECQELRHAGSEKYRAAARIASRAVFRMGTSATPIFNYGGEIFNVLDVLRPDCLGTQAEFNREWCNGDTGNKPKIKSPSAFGTYARREGLMLRRTREEVGRELPALTTVRHEIDADLAELDKVEDAAAELARVILAQGNETFKGERMRAAEELSWKLRQATGIAKARPVAEFVRILVDNGEKVLLAGWHREVYGIWQSRLKDLAPAFYTGTESDAQKAESIRRFKANETDVLIMSLRSGAGVDGLQEVCRTVVFGEIDWSFAVHTQFTGRIYRDGQTDPVVAYYLVSESGSDPVVADVLGIKRQQLEGIIDPNADMIERLQTDGNHIRRLALAYLNKRRVKGPLALIGG